MLQFFEIDLYYLFDKNIFKKQQSLSWILNCFYIIYLIIFYIIYLICSRKLSVWLSSLQVIIDIEWGAFGDNGVLDFIKTDFDRENDANSLIVNSFT